MATSDGAAAPDTGDRWLTRDEDGDGVVSSTVDVWCQRPERWRVQDGGGWCWLGPGTSGLDARVAQLSLEQAARQFRTLPDDAIQCVHFYGKADA